MRFYSKPDRRREWHRKFAWFPVLISTGEDAGVVVWLESYERRLTNVFGGLDGLHEEFEARLIGNPS